MRAATAQYRQASAAAVEWRTTVLEPLEEQVQVADRAFNEGEVAYLFVIEMNRRLTDARLRTREAEADIARALARLERAVGRRCGDRKERAPVASRIADLDVRAWPSRAAAATRRRGSPRPSRPP